MKFAHTLALALVVQFGAFVSPAAKADPAPGATEVEIPLQAVFAPTEGFDDNDNVQVVLLGSLPNGCYSLGRQAQERSQDGRTILVRQFALKRYTGVCVDQAHLPEHMKLSIPFTSEVSVGQLARGGYQIAIKHEDNSIATRPISVAAALTPSIDSAPYALVTSLGVSDVVSTTDHLIVTVSGLLNSTCTQIDENVKVLKQGDVFVLLPTVKVKNLALCTQLRQPYFLVVDLGKTGPGHYLIHSRSMNGKSMSKVIEVIDR